MYLVGIMRNDRIGRLEWWLDLSRQILNSDERSRVQVCVFTRVNTGFTWMYNYMYYDQPCVSLYKRLKRILYRHLQNIVHSACQWAELTYIRFNNRQTLCTGIIL